MAGAAELHGPLHSLVSVPTSALIASHGRWWVLVRGESGQDVAREVVPGPSRGWRTYIKSGLEPGQKVVVSNAYLEFHRDVSKNYQPPN